MRFYFFSSSFDFIFNVHLLHGFLSVGLRLSLYRVLFFSQRCKVLVAQKPTVLMLLNKTFSSSVEDETVVFSVLNCVQRGASASNKNRLTSNIEEAFCRYIFFTESARESSSIACSKIYQRKTG